MEEIARESKRTGIKTAVNIVRAINNVTGAIFFELQKRHSDLVRENLTLVYQAGESSSDLPEDFGGLMTRPYISGRRQPLEPIAPEDKLLFDGKQSTSQKFFELMGGTLLVYPTPATAVTVKGDYAKKPLPVSGMADPIPYTDHFLSTVRIGVLLLNKYGLLYAETNEFKMALNDQLSDTLVHRKGYRRRVKSSIY